MRVWDNRPLEEMSKHRLLFVRFCAMQQALAFFTALCLALPNSVLALRQTGLEEQTDDQGKPVGPKAELVAALRVSSIPAAASVLPIVSAAGMEEWKELNYHLTRLGSDSSGAIGLALEAIDSGLRGRFQKHLRSGEIAIAVLESLQRVHSSDPAAHSGLQQKHLLVLQALMQTDALEVASEEQLGKIAQILGGLYSWLDETRPEKSLFEISMLGFSLHVFAVNFVTKFGTKIPAEYQTDVRFLSIVAPGGVVQQKNVERHRLMGGGTRALERARKKDITSKIGALHKFFARTSTPGNLLEALFSEGARVIFINYSLYTEGNYITSASGLVSDIQALSGQTESPLLLGLNLPPSQEENFYRFLSGEEVPDTFLKLISDRIPLYDPTDSDEAAIARESLKAFLTTVRAFAFYGSEPEVTGENIVDTQVHNLHQVLKQNPNNRILVIDGPPELDDHILSKKHLHWRVRSHQGAVAYSLAPFLKQNLSDPSIVVSIVVRSPREIDEPLPRIVLAESGGEGLGEFLDTNYSNRSFGIRLGKGKTPFDKNRFALDFKETFKAAYDGIIIQGRKDRGGDRDTQDRSPDLGTHRPEELPAREKVGARREVASMAGGLEEVQAFKSGEEFLAVYGDLLRNQGLLETAQVLAERSNHVTTIVGSSAPETPVAVIAYTHREWENAVDIQLKRGSMPSVFFVTSSYPANGLLHPPAVIIQQTGITLPAEPKPTAPVITLRSLADVGTLTPGFVYAVAVNKNLAGQVIGPIFGILTFIDEQGRTIHSVFA